MTEERAPQPVAGIDRRTVLKTTAATAGATAVVGVTSGRSAGAATSRYFRHGVASGDPLPDAVVLWTRVTPTPAATPAPGRARGSRWAGRSPPTRASATSSREGRSRPGRARDHTVKVDATRPRAGPLVLLPLPLRRRLLARRPHPHRPGRRRRRPPAALRRGVLLQLGGRLLRRLPAPRRPRRPATRCCTSATTSTSTAPASTARRVNGRAPHDPTHEIVTPRRLPPPARAVQDRPRPAGACTRRTRSSITWDDHEVANDAWSGGAENHHAGTEGDYAARAGRAPSRRTSSGCRCG